MIIRKGNEADLQLAMANLSQLDVGTLPEDMKITLSPVKIKRSNNQNALFWVWCEEFGNHTGNFKDYIYKYFEDKFCPIVERNINGEATFIKCAKKLDAKKFSEFMEKVYIWLETEADFKVEWPNDPRLDNVVIT